MNFIFYDMKLKIKICYVFVFLNAIFDDYDVIISSLECRFTPMCYVCATIITKTLTNGFVFLSAYLTKYLQKTAYFEGLNFIKTSNNSKTIILFS